MEILVKEYRGEIEDLLHCGIITITDENGKLLHSIGDPDRVVLARSSVKPIQAISVIESGAAREYDLTDREISQLCASHRGEIFHEECVRQILKKAGLDESYLKCGVHLPFDKSRQKEFVENNTSPTEIHCNCSGKHSGMLLTSKMMDYSLDDYWKVDHPVQQRILEDFAHVCDSDPEDVAIGIDGCGVPVHGLPMRKLAQGYARLAKPEVFETRRKKAVERIVHSMTTYPEMVSGTHGLCTELMTHFGDRLFAKGGANAYYAIGLKDKGIGIAIKMLDGNSKVMAQVVLGILFQMGVITKTEVDLVYTGLTDYNIYNHRKEVVGHRELSFRL